MNRREFLRIVGGSAVVLAGRGAFAASAGRKPNFIIIFCDDLGYGDVGCFGSEKHRTPNLDTMAREGMRLTSFYSSCSVCTPSRSSLMTGCYPRAVNMHVDSEDRCVLFPAAKKGLHPDEVTIADMLKTQGYSTACIGKWHLGDQPEFLPTRQGFDYYFGIPYSNDMFIEKRGHPSLPLMRDEQVIEAPPDQNLLTKRYTEEALKFIDEKKDDPFFLYLPHAMPHNPVHASEAFRGKSANKTYGDAVEEIDWSTGQILDRLKEHGIAEDTLVVFTSDNGASNRFGGSNGPLRGWKGQTLEGGMREPCIAWWPSHIPAGSRSDELTVTLDMLPTFAGLLGMQPPSKYPLDGADIQDILLGKPDAKTPHEAFYYYQKGQLQAVRSGPWKLHLALDKRLKNWGDPDKDIKLQLYNLDADIGEKDNVAAANPGEVDRLLALAEKGRVAWGDGDLTGERQRAAGYVVSPKPLLLEPKE